MPHKMEYAYICYQIRLGMSLTGGIPWLRILFLLGEKSSNLVLSTINAESLLLNLPVNGEFDDGYECYGSPGHIKNCWLANFFN